MQELICPWETSFWFFSENVPTLLYYSHIPAVVAALLIGIIVFVKNKKSTLADLLLSILFLFSIWTAIDVFLWANNRADLVMFWWSLQILIEPIIYALAMYMLYVFTLSKYPSLKINLATVVVLLPLVILLPTSYSLIGVDLSDCVAWEGPVALYYTYFLEALFIVGILATASYGIIKSKERTGKIKIVYFTIGLLAFLVAFTSGNIIGSLTGDWNLAQYGLFGMPVFIGFLAYLIIQYKFFNLKVFGAQVLVVALWILIGSLLLVVQSDTSRIVALITLVLSIWFGFMLVRSVKREIESRERVEALAKELKVANEGQANLIHIINHQIKGYLAKSRNIFSELLTESSYGANNDQSKSMLEEGFNSLTEGVDFVTDFLHTTDIEKGEYVYNMVPIDFKKIVEDSIGHLKTTAEEKALKLELSITDGDYHTKGDIAQLEQAIRNLVDNSIKYTPSGGIDVKLTKSSDKILLAVTDTGLGISDDLRPKLFTKGGKGKDSLKINVNSTGFGLSFVKDVIEAHKGRVWAESPGENQGSAFFMELPLNS